MLVNAELREGTAKLVAETFPPSPIHLIMEAIGCSIFQILYTNYSTQYIGHYSNILASRSPSGQPTPPEFL